MFQKETENICPGNLQEWRQWLMENHHSQASVWVIYYKKKSGKPSISWSDAVDEALCFGWIDSTRKTVDEHRFIQFFTKRKPKSVWSKINKEKVQKLIKEGRMTQAGLDSIERAKQNGSWNILDEAEDLLVPKDLEKELNNKPGAMDFFLGLSKSVRKSILQWLLMAKRPETRQKRIVEIAELAALKQKPKQFQ